MMFLGKIIYSPTYLKYIQAEYTTIVACMAGVAIRLEAANDFIIS